MLEKFNELIIKDKKENETENSEKITNVSNESIESPPPRSKNQITFQVSFSITTWNRNKPTQQIYHRLLDNEHRKLDRTYNVLPRGVWTYVVSQAIARQRKDIPCRWIFKRGKVYASGNKYITLAGTCTTCKAELNGYLRAKPESPIKNIRFIFEVNNMNISIHDQNKIQKNVKIGGEQIQALCEKQKPATAIRRDLLCESVELFEEPTERIMSANAIRCSKYRSRKNDRLDECPLKSLEVLKLSFYDKWIRSIGLDPFYVIYANTDQEILFKVYKKKNKTISVSCDATGGVVRKIGKWLMIFLLEFYSINNSYVFFYH